MARLPGIVIPGQPLHVIQRGNNWQAIFFSSDDYHKYLDVLRDARNTYGCLIHAYVLMTNHVHCLVTPEQGDIKKSHWISGPLVKAELEIK